MTSFRARFDGKVLIPEDSLDLPTDRLLEVHVNDARLVGEGGDALRAGSPAALLEVMRSFIPIPREDLDELNRLIGEGQMPVDFRGVFDEPGEDR